jgi:hypothetical protein
MMKVIVYLSDVDDGSGPFEYWDRVGTERGIRALNGRGSDFLPDASVREVIPQKHWRQLTGPRLTAIYANTCRILHGVKTPITSDRYSVTFVYSSTTPYYAFPHFMLPRGALLRLREELTPRQGRALMLD